MDAGQFVVDAAVAVVSGGAGALGMAWRLSSILTQLEERTKRAEDAANAAKQKAEETDTKLEEFTKEEADQWNQMNRSLGQIEGMLGAQVPTNPRLSRP